VPAVEVSSEAAIVAVDGVEIAPESRSSTGSDKVPEIKVVEPSPILKTKSNQDEGESEEVETQNERTEEKVVETEDKEGEGSKQTGNYLICFVFVVFYFVSLGVVFLFIY
jgi:hypothetical protein